MATMMAGFLIFYVILFICDIAFRVLLTLSINSDCKARDLKSTTAFSVLTFFFPVIVGIVYACVRNSAKKNSHPKLCTNCNVTVPEEAFNCPNCGNPNLSVWADPNSEKLKKKSVNLFIVAAVLYVVVIISSVAFGLKFGLDIAKNPAAFEEELDSYINQFDVDDYDNDYDYDNNYDYDIVYYDKMGNSYDDMDDVLYYDIEGNTYVYEFDDDTYYGFFINTQTREQYPEENCFVDVAGNLIYFENPDTLTLGDDYFTYTDADGNVYYEAAYVLWDANGELIF